MLVMPPLNLMYSDMFLLLYSAVLLWQTGYPI